KKAATWLPLPCTIRPLAVSNSTLIPSLPASHPDAQRHVVDLGVRVVLVQVALDGHAMDRRIGRIINPSVQGTPNSRCQRPHFAPGFGPAGELDKRLRRPQAALVRRQPPIAHPLVRNGGQGRLRSLVWPAAYRENPGADQCPHF